MNKLILMLVLALLVPCQSAWGRELSQASAVALAETFIVQNGYTNAAPSQIRQELDLESVERAESLGGMLQRRRNTLQSKAIGVR